MKTINLSKLDFKCKVSALKKGTATAINLSKLDFKGYYQRTHG